ncbi:MAG: TorF family putative porin [Alphaproteobacteria bacterium]|nr:TorF family putative porin [Alphaproteobacteria bacterium]MBU2270995.1 TorF family putative porin [Alphaproteobacteria bacterium]MBU2417964.1 TorF family putative porin [Alphaproteobacteria bacterium]
MSARFRDQLRRRLPLFAGLLAVCLSPTLANAQSVSGQVGVASQYVGKGAGKSDGNPSVFGSVEIEGGAFYASAFASSADLSSGAHAEIVTAIGYRPEFAGFEFDVSVVNRDLPGSKPGYDGNYWEYQADASRKLGPVSTRLRVNYTADGAGGTQEAWWVELQGGVAIDRKTKFTAAVAERSADGGAEYVAWNAGVKRKLTDNIALDVRWYDTDGHSLGEPYEGRLVGSIALSF